LRISGHAGFAAAGEDIVCAAASALVMSAAYGLQHHCGGAARVADEPGHDYVLALRNAGDPRAQAVLETALSGLRAIARSYPGYLDVRISAGIGPRRPKT
jgi:uncharacterized protein YsxB (DUF464 family)